VLEALVSASCTIRYADRSTPVVPVRTAVLILEQAGAVATGD
jgi:hypothetical protein